MIDDVSDAQIMRAMGHPLRRQIMEILDSEVASPKELAERLGEKLSAVSYHVNVLRDIGLLEVNSQRRRRGAVETHYRSGSLPVDLSSAWKNFPPSMRRSRWNTELRKLAQDLAVAYDRDTPAEVEARIAHNRMSLDAEGRRAASDCLHQMWRRLEEIRGASEQRSTPKIGVAIATLIFPVEHNLENKTPTPSDGRTD